MFQSLLLVLVFVGYVVPVKGNPSRFCASFTENGWVSSDPSKQICFWLYKERRTWWDAEEMCRKQGMFLATPSSESIDTFLWTHVRGKTTIWIGGINQENRGWKWSNGEPWDYNQMDVVSKTLDFLFGFFKTTTSCTLLGILSWEKADCNNLAPFVCQSKTNRSVSMLRQGNTLPDQGKCPERPTWICKTEDHIHVNPSGRLCFIYYEEKSTWWDANKTCNEHGMHLVAVNSMYIDSFLLYNIRRASVTDFWIGGINNGNKGWKWTNGEDITYEDFDGTALNLDRIFKDTLCALFGFMGWVKRGCYHLAPFVCQLTRNRSDLLPENLDGTGNVPVEGISNYTTESSRQPESRKQTESPRQERRKHVGFKNQISINRVKNPKLSSPGLATRYASSPSECVRICAVDHKCVLVNFCLKTNHCELYGNYSGAVSGEVTSEKGCVVYVNMAYLSRD